MSSNMFKNKNSCILFAYKSSLRKNWALWLLIGYKNVNKRTLLLLLLHNSLKIPLANVVRLLAKQSETKSNVKLDGFWSRLLVSYVSSHTEEFW